MKTLPERLLIMCIRQNLAVSLVLAISMVGVSYGAGGNLPGDGLSESTAYLIEDLADFDVFANQANAAIYWASGVYTKLACDPNLAGRPYTTAVIAMDTPDTSDNFDGIPFKGVFDGNGHVVSNLTIDTVGAGNDYLGLFGKIGSNTKVENLGVENVNITSGDGSMDLGGLAGWNRGSINNCYATGSVTGSYWLGGLVGESSYDSITNCYATGSVSGYSHLGGLVGRNDYGSISNCYATGSVSGGHYWLGGLVGYHWGGTISDCYATGAVTGGDDSEYLGGLCGYNSSGTIANCYATGSVTGGNNSGLLGGLVGSCGNYISNCYATGNVVGGNDSKCLGGLVGRSVSYIRNCYATGNVVGGDNSERLGGLVGENRQNVTNCYSTGCISGGLDLLYLGGLVGYKDGGSIIDCFWDMDISGMDTSAGGTGKTTQQMQTQSTFTDAEWDFVGETGNGTDSIWIMKANNYPWHWHRVFNGNGTESDPFLIESLDDFDEFVSYTSYWAEGAYTRLETDIDLTGRPYTTAVIAPDTSSSNGFQGTMFTGTFDGNDHKIINLTINTAGADNDYLGLFGKTDYSIAVIQNLGIEDYNIIGGNYSWFLGGLVGGNRGGISNCYATGSVTGGDGSWCLGGLCGYSQCDSHIGYIISNCYATGSVTGGDDSRFLGGLVGDSDNPVSDCYATGSVNGGAGSECLGGLCGNNGGTITNCYAAGSVTGDCWLGGLCGYNEHGTITDCYATGAITGDNHLGGLCGHNDDSTITNCYATGAVIGNDYLGGLCGKNNDTITNCFWDIETGGPDNGIGTPKTTAQMQDIDTYLNAGWDFVGETDNGSKNIWKMPADESYPILRCQITLSGSGTEVDPYLIQSLSDFDDFTAFFAFWDGYVLLECDIDLSGRTYTTAIIAPNTGEYSPYFSGTAFTGEFDGNGYTITNLTIDATGAENEYLGLFGQIDPCAVVQYLRVANCSIIGGDSSRYAGGLVGRNHGSISNCYATGSVNGGAGLYGLGGLVGRNHGSISNCYATGSVTGGDDSDSLGGLCGCNSYGEITNCYATGSVTGDDELGGLCGKNYYGTITNCYATGEIIGGAGSRYLGGLCGENYYGTISNCHAAGSVTGDDYLGGLCGYNSSGTTTNCYFYLLGGPDNSLGTALNDLQMQDAVSFAGFDFAGNPNDGEDDYWTIMNGHCPKLTWQTDDGPLVSPPVTTLSGSGYSYNPFQINSYADFTEFRTNSRLNCGYYILTVDIDLSGETFSTAVINGVFGGHFDGNGYVIRNVTIDTAGADNDDLGLFGRISASVSNLGIENINITGEDVSDYLGGLCGYNYEGTITNCYATGSVTGGDGFGGLCGHNYYGLITNCHAACSVNGRTGSDYFGSLCGKNSGTITNCYATGSVTGGTGSDYLGGLCGSNYGTISNCYATGSVTGYHQLGGLCGFNSYGTITSCYAIGSVTGYNCLGGLCGYNYEGTITNCSATGSVTGGSYSKYFGGLCGKNYHGNISNCYAIGSVSAMDYSQYLGGLCGYNESGAIIDCFWDTQTSGMSVSDGGTGKTTDEMQTRSTFTDEGWDFVGEDANGTNDFWRMCLDGVDYPKLSWQFLAGDFVCRDGVDLADFAVLAETWGLSAGQAGYNELCDLIDDDTIDLDDLAVFVENWLAGK